MLNIPEFFGFLMNSSKISSILREFWRQASPPLQAIMTSFEGKYTSSLFWIGARASYASLPQCSLFPFSLLSGGPFLYFGSNAASLKWFFFATVLFVVFFGFQEFWSFCTVICIYVSLSTLFASRPSGGHFYHILKASISSCEGKHCIFWRQV